MADELKNIVDRAAMHVEEHYDFDAENGSYLGDVTIDDEGRYYAVSLRANHMEIEPLLKARAKAIRAAREARYARMEAALRFYADPENWRSQKYIIKDAEEGEEDIYWHDAAITHDTGEIVRRALEEIP